MVNTDDTPAATPLPHLPGRKEIREWIDGWIARYSGDPFLVTTEQLFELIGRNLGWWWDIEDVGVPPEGALAGLFAFLKETMAAKKAAREERR